MKSKLLVTALVALVGIFSSNVQAQDLAAVHKRGEIIIGTLGTAEPDSFVDPKTRQLVGYDIDIGTRVAEIMGVRPVFKPISVAARIPELQQGHVDILSASLSYTKARAELIDFSFSNQTSGQKALVRKGINLDSLNDLKGKKFATIKGGTQEANTKARIPSAKFVLFDNAQQALLALQQKKVDVYVDDIYALQVNLNKLSGAEKSFQIIPEWISTSTRGIGLRKNSDLTFAVNRALKKLEESGEAERIFLKWYGPGTAVNAKVRDFKFGAPHAE